METGSFGGSIPALYDQCHARFGATASTRPSRCAKASALADRSRVGGSSRRGIFAVSLPVSAKARQRIAHQRAALLGAVENQTVPGGFLFRSFDGTARASEKRNHLARESLKPLGVNVHKHVKAVGRTLVDPLLHKVDNLLRDV